MIFPSPAPRRAAGNLPICLLMVFSVATEVACKGQEPNTGIPSRPAAVLQQLRSFNQWGSVLYVAAHPDDENTQLIAYLARGRDYRTAYLSLTRGDGGQNVLGPGLGEKLGVARTQELLAARRIDGGRQYFTRAIDFGFSKDYKETLSIWDHDTVLSDVVRVIREFRPDVIITRFSPQPSGTHGHHTASAVLAMEAFKMAGDPQAFPDPLRRLKAFQPVRLFVNGRGGGEGSLGMEVGGTDPVSGSSFGELAGRSRAMHKTQGFDNFSSRGSRSESFQLLAGEPATNDILDGIGTTWKRVPGGEEVGRLTGELLAEFNPNDLAANIPALLRIRDRLLALGDSDPILVEKRQVLDGILQACLGLDIETRSSGAEIVPGESMQLSHVAKVSSRVPVRWVAVQYPGLGKERKLDRLLKTGEQSVVECTELLPANTPLTQPYWLREKGTAGTARVEDPSLIGHPENPPAFPIRFVFDVAGQPLIVSDEPVHFIAGDAANATRQPLQVIPPVSLHFESDVKVFAPGQKRIVTVIATANRGSIEGPLALRLEPGWKAEPAQQAIQIEKAGAQVQLQFAVTAPGRKGIAVIGADAQIGGRQCSSDREEIRYNHIPPQLLQPRAELKAICEDIDVWAKNIGYLPGAGDEVADSLNQIGCSVTLLEEADLTVERLREFDAVILGVRAFNVRRGLADHLPGLFAYVEQGGTVIAQYNRPDNARSFQVAPYPLRLSQRRVTDETAEVTFLAPEHPALNTPNKITAADFEGWIQERGIYFPQDWDEKFTPLIACHDPGESPMEGGLLVARHGRGHYVYTGLVFFRELPAGVPGAYRLFANLLSLGKSVKP